MMKNLAFIIIVSLLVSCKPNPNGDYILYKSKPKVVIAGIMSGSNADSDTDYAACRALANELKGRKCNVEITDKYAVVKGLFASELVFDREDNLYKQNATDTTYYIEKTINNKLTKIILTDHTIRKTPEISLRVMTYSHPTDSLGKYALAWCELQKFNN